MIEINVQDLESLERVPVRDGFGEGLLALGHAHDDVVALCADLSDSTRVAAFAKAFPERFVQVGVAEQNMAVLAAGMACEGKVPFITSYAVFCPGRNWDQIRISLCYNDVNVKVIGSHAGISVGPDGATHQALEDIALMRVLPNMRVVVPCDRAQAAKATEAIYNVHGPCYLRLARDATPVMTQETTPFELGKAQCFREGTDVSIFACGPLVYEALLAAQQLQLTGVSAEVLNIHTIKPLDTDAIVASAQKTGAVVTVEEHQIHAGLGAAVAETLSEQLPTPLRRVGMRDQFGASGSPQQLIKAFGMDATAIAKAARDVLAIT